MTEEDVFRFPRFGFGAVRFWEKTKHWHRETFAGGIAEGVQANPFVEFLAWRAQLFILAGEAHQLSNLPVFDSDVDALAQVSRKAQAVRAAAS